MPQINTTLDALAAVVTAILLCNCLFDRAYEDKQRVPFIGMLLSLLVILVTDLFDWVANGNADARILLYISNTVNYTAGYVIIIFFDRYLSDFLNDRKGWMKTLIRAFDVLCIISSLLMVVNLFTGIYFTIGADGVYTRGGLYWLSQAFPVAALLTNAGIIAAWPGLSLGTRLVFGTYPFFPFAGIIVDFFRHGWALTYVGAFLSVLIIYTQIYIRRGRRLLRQKNQLQAANVAIMLSQIQPHFLYNSLSAIASLCHGAAPEAEEATVEFAEYLRCNLDSINADKPISFTQELRHTQNYLALEKRRFDERLNVEWDIQDELFRLPALTLQPIAENAVKCGVTKKERGGTIWISSRKAENAHVVTVRDDGVGFDVGTLPKDGRSHMGICSVRDRLRIMCDGTLEISSIPGEGTTAVITIPIPKEASDS